MSSAQARPGIAKVIDQGFCIGCGACASIDPGFKLAQDEAGFLLVRSRPSSPALLERASRVCPFADAPNEDEIAAAQFGSHTEYTDGIGYHLGLFAGWSTEFREVAGSGGITRWLYAELLGRGDVDFVVVVDEKTAADEAGEPLFYYAIHDTRESMLAHVSTSAYYPVSLAGLIEEVRARQGTFAVTALPCFARALRALALEDPVFGARLRYVSGTICGSLKSRRYAEYLAAQMGVAPAELGRINFRGKSKARIAKEKCVEVWDRANRGEEPTAVARVQELKGTDYGSGYFKYRACDYCDDVVGETADISFGDAWIEPYLADPGGTNVVIVRNPQIAEILDQGRRSGALVLDPLTPEEVIATQASGLRHRREGLRIRLWFARARGAWAPRKRVGPHLPASIYVLTQLLRVLIRRFTAAKGAHVSSSRYGLVVEPLVIAQAWTRRIESSSQLRRLFKALRLRR